MPGPQFNSTPSHPSTDPLTPKLNARSAALARLEHAGRQLRRLIAEESFEDAHEAREVYKIAFQNFESQHDQVITNISDADYSLYSKESQFYDTVCDDYIELLSFANTRLCSSTNSASSNQGSGNDIMSIVNSIKSPQVVLDQFDGSEPQKFLAFIKKFDLSMQGCHDYKYLTQMLLQCTKGDAYRDLQGILYIEDPKIAFEEGRQILFSKYGDPSEIAFQLVKNLKAMNECNSGPEIKIFAAELRSAQRILIELKMLDRMMSDDLVNELALKLPYKFCTTWSKRSRSVHTATGFYADFTFLCNFVQECSDLLNDKVVGQSFLDRKNALTLQSQVKSKQKPTNLVSSHAIGATGGHSVDPSSYHGKSHGSADPTSSCPLCDKSSSHKLWNCHKFKAMKVPQRIKLVKEKRLCWLCFSSNHFSRSCSRTNTCKVDGCNKRHSTWIHGINDYSISGNDSSLDISTPRDPVVMIASVSPGANVPLGDSANQPMQSAVQSVIDSETGHAESATAGCGNISLNSQCRNQDLRVHMPIVRVLVNGQHVALAALDSFSTATFCSERLVKQCNLPLNDTFGPVKVDTMIGKACKSGLLSSMEIQPMDRSTSVRLDGIFVWDRIPVKCNELDVSQFDHLKNLDLVTGEINEVDILIGQDYSECLMPLHTYRGKERGMPFATQTILGICLNGSTKDIGYTRNVSSSTLSTHVCCLNVSLCNPVVPPSPPSLDKIEQEISRLYEIENPPDQIKMSQDDQKVINLWESQMTRVGNKYELPIPFKDVEEEIPNNYPVVKAINDSLVKRLKRKGTFQAYDKKMRSLIEDGYVEIIEPDPYNNPGRTNYIPHHDVYHPRKVEPRIVHNAKFKFKGKSLNDRCYQGPNFLSRADSVLTQFRLHRYAFEGDIKAMYFQVIIPTDQRDMLRFLWFDEDGNLIHLRHCRHIFGGVWCSSSSQFVLRKSIETEDNDVIRNAVLSSFYVDDCLRSVDQLLELIILTTALPAKLSDHGYTMTKMLVNDPSVLETIPEEHRAPEVKNLTPDDQVHAWALGIRWNVSTDTFHFEFSLPDHDLLVNSGTVKLTKRKLLSIVSSVYDLLGLISPMITYGRILFQHANRSKLSWDQALPEPLITKWGDWVECLRNVSQLQIPRCVKPSVTSHCSLELHTFADASMDAYCAVSYLRAVDSVDQLITCNMIRSKSKVAPIKQLSIPRLELQACLMACRLASMIKKDLHEVQMTLYFWTDSMIALSYIDNDTKQFLPYVANRLTDIHLLSAKSSWNHVDTKSNPADLGTRAKIISHTDLLNSAWFKGPEWLQLPRSEWPVSSMISVDLDNDPEVRVCSLHTTITDQCEFNDPDVRVCCLHTSVTEPDIDLITRIINHYSSFFMMRRAVAYLSRFICSLTDRPVQIGPLSLSEIKQGEAVLIRYVQAKSFPNEILRLAKGQPVRKSSSIAKLSPFLDADGILRVGGRTGDNPILLQNTCKLSTCIIQAAHVAAHTGVEWTLSIVRKRYWVIKGRAAVKKVVMACVSCKRLYEQPAGQFMASLPIERITPGLPVFSNVGIDVFGPYYIRNYRSNIKRWLVLFTCMATRAVHLEVIFSLDTSSMINAVRRFIARRGQPLKAFSDQGTNLTGAYNDLRASWKDISVEQLKCFAVNKAGFDWQFISPRSPWKGGVWERLIGVSKRIAKGIRGTLDQNSTMNDEVLSTLFCEVENMVNGRPLTKMNDDPNDFSCISPNHLLIGRSGLNMPPGVFSPDDMYRKGWKHAQSLACKFWKIWLRSYLPELQGRQKWLDAKSNLSVGDLVLLMDTSCPRNLWPLAVITSVKESDDNLVRTVNVRTRASKDLERSVNQLILLESKVPDSNPKTLRFKNIYK